MANPGIFYANLMRGYFRKPEQTSTVMDRDGWFNTDDQVEVDGEYIRILGRASEIINIGGQKVYPTEVESVIHEMSNVAEVTVYGEANFIMGNIVCTRVRLKNDEPVREFTIRLKKYCREKIEEYKVPVKVFVNSSQQHSERFKKVRFHG